MALRFLLPVALAATLFHSSAAAPSTHKTTKCPDGKNSAQNPQCCPWFTVRDALISDIFEGICGENAHSTVRIAFHDAIGFSIYGGKGDGADGSIIAFGETELAYHANAGIDDIVTDLQPFADEHHISYGDVIQFGAAVALSLCPGAPKVQTFVGRPNATAAAPDGTVPEPFDAISDILERLADAGFSSDELIALLSSHSIAAQDEIEPAIHGAPFDSTPSSFDPQIFLEVLLKPTGFPGNGSHQGEAESPLAGEFRLESDSGLARDSRTACTWQSFIGNQALMASKFSTAMTKLSLTGCAKNLIDCTEVIQAAPPATETAAILPPGKTREDIQSSCPHATIPALSTQSGTPTPIPVVPEQ